MSLKNHAIAALAAAFAACGASAATITLIAPEDGALFDTHSPCVKEFYANFEKRGERPERPPLTEEAKKQKEEDEAAGKTWHDRFDYFMFNDFTKDWNKRNQEEQKTWKPFEWKADFSLDQFAVEFSETEDFAGPIVQKVDRKWDRGIRPKFLKLGTRYWWRVKAVDADGAEVVSDVRTFTTADVPPRIIDLPSYNTRDMGGGTNVFGAKVRQGLLYRSPAPACNKDEPYYRDYYLDKLGIVMELDLRGTNEVNELRAKWGEGNLDALVKHVCVPTEDYHLYHPRTAECMPKLFACLADRNNYPILTHCSAGSDRTGTFGVLIDAVLGRDDRYIYDDFESPSFSPFHPRFRYGRKPSGLFATLDPTHPRHDQENLHGLTGANIRENAVQFLLSIGVKQEHIDAFREIMLEPATGK